MGHLSCLKVISGRLFHAAEHTHFASENAILLDTQSSPKARRFIRYYMVKSAARRYAGWIRKAQARPPDDCITIAQFPNWFTNAVMESPEDVEFLSGAALAHLHLVARSGAIPEALWRARLALAAAWLCVGFAGRREGEAVSRDAVHLT